MTHRNEVINGVIQTKPRHPTDSFNGMRNLKLTAATMQDYWQWAYSDIISNTNRGTLAEFIVAKALGATASVRIEWDAFDLRTRNGIRVEVKSSAYLQLWHQQGLSKPRFSIGKTREWCPQTGKYVGDFLRHSDVYVFSLLAYSGEKELLDPMDLEQWEFYVVATHRIDEGFNDRKSISLPQIKKLSCMLTVDELAEAVVKEHEKTGRDKRTPRKN